MREHNNVFRLAGLAVTAAMLLGCDNGPETAGSVSGLPPGGDPERGAIAIGQYACTSCHVVPGVVGPDVRVGPTLEGIARRKYIAGVLPNTPENMILWILDPVAVDPLTAMPDMGVTETDALDMAAYLYSRR